MVRCHLISTFKSDDNYYFHYFCSINLWAILTNVFYWWNLLMSSKKIFLFTNTAVYVYSSFETDLVLIPSRRSYFHNKCGLWHLSLSMKSERRREGERESGKQGRRAYVCLHSVSPTSLSLSLSRSLFH